MKYLLLKRTGRVLVLLILVDCGIKFRDTVFLCFCVINFQLEPLFKPVYRLYNVLSTVAFTVSEHAKGASGFSVRD